MLNAFGVAVHLVEMMDRILPLEDAGTVAVLDTSLRQARRRHHHGHEGGRPGDLRGRCPGHPRGPRGRTHDGRSRPGAGGGRPHAEHRRPRPRAGGHRASSAGSSPSGTGTGPRSPSVYAIGDVVNTPMLAHVASKEGEIAAEHIAGRPGPASTCSRSRAPSTASPRWRASDSPRKRRRKRLRRGDQSIPAGRVRQDDALILTDRAAAGLSGASAG